MKPAGAQYERNNLYYKEGFRGMMFVWEGLEWIRTNTTLKELKTPRRNKRGSTMVDITGQTRGYLKIKSFAGRNSAGSIIWNVICVCNKELTVTTSNLNSGNRKKSCGCRRYE